MRVIDLTGKRFGRLQVIERANNIGNGVAWLCRCDCGNEKIILGHSLRNGKTKSCGCYRKETATIQANKNSAAKFLGRKINSCGYVAVFMPEHPNANCTGHVLEHRLVATEILGRPLEKCEVVHHMNGDRRDNRKENLKVMTTSEHSSLHRKIDHWKGKIT